MVAPKKTAAKRPAAKRVRKPAAKKPMAAEYVTLAADAAAVFVAGIAKLGGTVRCAPSKDGTALSCSAKVGETRIGMRITQR